MLKSDVLIHKKFSTSHQNSFLFIHGNIFSSRISGRGVRSRLFWTPAPVLTNQTPDPAPATGQCFLFILLLLFDSCFYAKASVKEGKWTNRLEGYFTAALQLLSGL